MKLKDYKQLIPEKIYRFDNLSVVWTGDMLMSKYPQETMWYPWYEDKWFDKWKDRELVDTGKTWGN